MYVVLIIMALMEQVIAIHLSLKRNMMSLGRGVEDEIGKISSTVFVMQLFKEMPAIKKC